VIEQDRDETRKVMALWRTYVARHEVARPIAASTGLAITALNDAKARVESWLPPRTGLPFMLAKVATAWQTSWTVELTNHVAWPTVTARLAEVHQLLNCGSLVDAILELESILSDGCRGVRQVLASDHVRRIDDLRTNPSDQELREGLSQLLRWLETLRMT
jgi:hypothetical protein